MALTTTPPADGPNLEALLDAMTLPEQVSLLTGRDFWSTPPIPRLGIPSVKVTDGPNGARGGIFKDGPRTACFPVGVALACAWDVAAAEAMGAALATEAKQKGAQVLLGPTINLQRTVYNGRNFECHSEDPWLAAEMAVALVRGLQGNGVAATLKHFVGNESEYQRMTISSEIPERALRELYLLPFERAVKEAQPLCVMTGYNRVAGAYMADHHRLLSQVLRDEWGFDGLVMSDWYAHHHTTESVVAGCDLEMPGPTRQRGAALVQAVEEGRVTASAVRAAARRVLQLAQRTGRFVDGEEHAERAEDLPATRSLIRRLGSAGAVLLRNDGILPLAPQAGQHIALIGRAATDAQIMGGGSAQVNAHHRVTPLDALTAALPGVRFSTCIGSDVHRNTPTLTTAVTLEYFATPDLSGPVVATETVANTETIWADRLPAGIPYAAFSVRARLRHVATADGEYQFGVISAGRSRMRVNGELLLDAWSDWQRGDNYFTWGCDEVRARRTLRTGDTLDIQVDYTSVIPNDERAFRGLRFGVACLADEREIEAAVAAAREADVAVVFAGLNAEWDNEGLDRPGIELPHRQNELIARVAAVNPRTVVVLQSGSPLLLPWLDQVAAVLQAWYPGQECGHAIADMLTGVTEPGGRLAQTWPRRIEDTVAWGEPRAYPGRDGQVFYDEGLLIGYRHHDAHGIEPQFPFGFGLGYTQFALENLQLDRSTFQPGDAPAATVTVRNTGTRRGSTVVQAYVHDVASTLERPPQELKAFCKVTLDAGASTTVTLSFAPRAFAAFDDTRAAWVAEAGAFEIRVGQSSRDTPLRATVTLAADWVAQVSRR